MAKKVEMNGYVNSSRIIARRVSIISFETPKWLSDFSDNLGRLQTDEDKASFVIEASYRNICARTGGPFAAAVFNNQSGELVSVGVNLVTTQRLSMLHAEMVALAAAQRLLGSYTLGDLSDEYQLVTSTEPCAMCLGAIVWSGITSVLSSATDSDARAIGFDEGPKVSDWKAALQSRGIKVRAELCRSDAKRILRQYHDMRGEIYNGRA
jgi:tRNA(Arg) A34 adenosine deaminase TadA